MPSLTDLPRDAQRLAVTFSKDAQEKLFDLYGRYKFTDDQLEAFGLNKNGGKNLNADQLEMFQEFLGQEAQAQTAANAKKAPAVTNKRRQPTPSSNNAAVNAALGAVLGNIVNKTNGEADVTPYPKRSRQLLQEGDDQTLGQTPEAVAKPGLPVTLKSSINGQLDKKPDVGGLTEIVLLGDPRLWTGKRHGAYEWMDESTEDRAEKQDKRLASLEGAVTELLCKKYESEQVSPGVVGRAAQAEVVLCGRIACEGLEGRLNERSLLLEGSQTSSNGASVRLNIAECKSFGLFPGQIVGALGRSGMSGTTFHARDLVAGLPTLNGKGGERKVPVRPTNMMVASGPFCLRSNLDYAPLERVFQHAAQEKPQVLVLLGPFLDAANTKVLAGETVLPGEQAPCPYEDFYNEHILPLLVRNLHMLRSATGQRTEVLIVPSLDEVLCFHPLPQPPLDVSLGLESDSLANLGQFARLLPNPAHVEVNGMRVSLSSADALSPLAREIVLRPEGQKIEQALRALLGQRSLFPVLPREPVQVSEAHAAAFDFPGEALPDMCIFPSATGMPTAHLVDDTVFVNPGNLCRPAALGQFADVWVAPANASAVPLRERVRVDIQKLG